MFNSNGEEEAEPIVFLQFNQKGDLKEYNRYYAGYMFLTKILRWKECLEVNGSNNEFGEQNVKCLTQYLFLTQQVGWKTGLKVFQEKDEESIKKELQ